MLSNEPFVFINVSVTCSSSSFVSFNTRPSVDSSVPINAYHFTIYVSSVSFSDTPLYIFRGFCFEIAYLFVGLDIYFPTVNSNVDSYIVSTVPPSPPLPPSPGSPTSDDGTSFSQFITDVELATFDLYGLVNSSFGLLYPS